MQKMCTSQWSRRVARLPCQQRQMATTLFRNTNQAQGLAEFAIEFMEQDENRINDEVYDRVRLFHTDSVICGISALALRTNAPTILRNEAI